MVVLSVVLVLLIFVLKVKNNVIDARLPKQRNDHGDGIVRLCYIVRIVWHCTHLLHCVHDCACNFTIKMEVHENYEDRRSRQPLRNDFTKYSTHGTQKDIYVDSSHLP